MATINNQWITTCWSASLLILLSTAVGCEEAPVRYPVAGKVLIDGDPLNTGSIRFVPKSGRPFTSAILEDGSFELSENAVSTSQVQLGVFPGTYQVAVSATKILDEVSDDVEWLAPSKYADFRTSGIEVQVTGPQEDLQIELTWEGEEQTDFASAAESDAQEETRTKSDQAGKEASSDASLDKEASKTK